MRYEIVIAKVLGDDFAEDAAVVRGDPQIAASSLPRLGDRKGRFHGLVFMLPLPGHKSRASASGGVNSKVNRKKHEFGTRKGAWQAISRTGRTEAMHVDRR
jgi:hypothetical protein